MKKILSLLLAIVILTACKKNKDTDKVTDPPIPVSPAEIQRKADSAFNSKLIPGLGNIYKKVTYTPLQNDIRVFKFLQGQDTIYYYGKTDAAGEIAQVNGFKLNTSKGDIIRFELNRTDSLLLLHNLFADTSKTVMAIEIRRKSDSLISISLYKVGSGIKTLLYERLKKGKQPLFRHTANTFKWIGYSKPSNRLFLFFQKSR